MICIIGGSGFYDFLEDGKNEDIETPYGQVNMKIGMIDGIEVGFVPRHGKNHSLMPHLINYRANIYAIHLKKASCIITTNAVGSLRYEYKPGTFSLPDSVLDFTNNRPSYFNEFDNYNPSKLFSSILQEQILKIVEKMEESIVNGGTIVVTNGPRFETKAEIDAYRKLGADYVGMTTVPEVFLANQVKIPYVSLGIISNLAAGMQKEISADEVYDLFSEKISIIKDIIRQVIINIDEYKLK